MPLDKNEINRELASLLDWLPLFEALSSVFIEMDGDDKVLAVRGDSEPLLGLSPDALGSKNFVSLFNEKDKALWHLVKEKLRKTPSLPPFPMRIVKPGGQTAAVELIVARSASGGAGHVQLAVSKYHGQLSLDAKKRPRSSQPRSFEKSDFEPLADRLSQYAKEEDETPIATLMRLAGVGDATAEKSTSAAEGLWAVHKLLGDAAAEQTAKRSATVAEERSQKESEGALTRETGEMKAAVRSAYHQSGDTNYVTVAGEDGISEAEAVKAAVYAMKQAASSERAVTMKALTGGYERRLEKVRNQLRVFKKIVVQEKFDVALQPIVDLNGGGLHHFEALARFDANFYSGSPFEFMCFAEDVGVIHEFDLAMTMRVVSLLKRVRRIGFDAKIAVNISGRSIQSQAFLRHFFRILEDCADIRNQLSFELTESSQIDDLETTNRVLSRIRDFGHKVALDDFGAGAAGLQYLRVLKVDYVKIDGIYVRKALEDAESRAFLKSITDLCSGLGIQTIGECIEVHEQEELLAAIGVGYGQGWLYGKPQPVDEALTLHQA